MAEDTKDKERGTAGLAEENRSLLSYFNPFYNVISSSQILLFTKYFATLIKAGIPVLRSLTTLSRQMNIYRFKKLIWQMRFEVEGGMPLNLTFKKNDDVFGLLYVNLIKVGEESGRLYYVLDRLATLLDRQIKINRKVLSALTYPAIITLVSTGVVAFLMLYVIPQFSKLFAQFGQELPMPTRIVIGTSDFIADNVLNILAGILFLFLGYYQINQTTGGKRFFDTIKLKIPIFGGLIQKYNIALFSRNLSVLFQSGIPIISGIQISIGAIDNLVIAEAMIGVLREIEGGIPISRALAKTQMMPELAGQMIEIGEESGNLDEMLEKVAEFYEDEINFLVDQLAALIEPAFIIILGTVVGGIVLAMYLPIFRMARVVSGSAGVQTGGGS